MGLRLKIASCPAVWLRNEQGHDVELAMAGGVPQHFGWYRFYFEDERWKWSPEVARLHSYEPGEVTPTTPVGAVAQASGRLRAGRRDALGHPPRAQAVQHPSPHHHRRERDARSRRDRGAHARQRRSGGRHAGVSGHSGVGGLFQPSDDQPCQLAQSLRKLRQPRGPPHKCARACTKVHSPYTSRTSELI